MNSLYKTLRITYCTSNKKISLKIVKMYSDAKNVWKQGRDGRDTRIQLPYIYCIT